MCNDIKQMVKTHLPVIAAGVFTAGIVASKILPSLETTGIVAAFVFGTAQNFIGNMIYTEIVSKSQKNSPINGAYLNLTQAYAGLLCGGVIGAAYKTGLISSTTFSPSGVIALTLIGIGVTTIQHLVIHTSAGIA